MGASADGRFVQVVEVVDDHKLVIEENALKKILLDPRVRNSKIMVMSVSEVSGLSKHGVLGLLLGYFKSSICNDDCIHSTRGIYMWSEPFFVTSLKSETVCVLLVDITVKGMMDSVVDASFISIGLLISSVHVLVGYIDSVLTLRILKAYNDFSYVALKEYGEDEFELPGKYIKETLKAYRHKPFQKLQFVFQHWGQTECSHKDDSEYLRKVKRDIQGRYSSWHFIFRSYADVKFCITPRLSAFPDEFSGYVKSLVEALFQTENILIKTINGKEITGEDLLECIKEYVEAFQYFEPKGSQAFKDILK